MSGIPERDGFFVLVDMGRGRATPIETIERIKATHAMTGSIRQTARDLGVPVATVAAYVNTPSSEQIEQARTEKIEAVMPSIIDEIAAAQRAIIKAMRDPSKIAEADMRDLATAFGILTDKHQLLTGQPTARNHNLNQEADPAPILTPEELEQMAQLRERLASGMAG